MLGFLLQLFSSRAFKDLSEGLNRAYEAKLTAQTDEQKIEADITIKQLETRQQLLLAEQKRWITAWIRPLGFGLPVSIVVWKLLVWDYVLNLGTTPQPGELIQWIIVTVIGAYMLTRPFERK